ncbi:Carboxylesterase patB [Lachnellula arida]|uniref:Carboxylic ester hydrolase n=1 Tax=Lachnellula arida TaxID=1316785 RepID=A0A8T9B565_9HELO|nr:Carboxylesterase patB [Lachnellula arida]
MFYLAAIAASFSVVNAVLQSRTNSTLPVVDLGYELHRAANVNSTSSVPYYNFTNIRFGQPPVGTLRFNPPVAPSEQHSKVITDGTEAIRTCPQATPTWELEAAEFLGAYLSGGNLTAYTSKPWNTTSGNQTIPTPGPGEVEDCLFLDVFTPTKVFDLAQNHTYGSGAPVLVWIYGGGYTAGSKSLFGSPASLIARSTQDGADDGVIFVELNYRLGVFGWLTGNNDITANAGLLDQRLALEWVHNNIYKFGGDPNRVTVMGESAGAGSIMHHITSPPNYTQHFQRAIPQSPAFIPFLPSQGKPMFDSILKVASTLTGKNVSSASDLRALPFNTLYAVNAVAVGTSPYGTFTFGPVVDNSYVPDIPLRRLAAGLYHQDITVMVGHNADEGLLFAPPYLQGNAEWYTEFKLLFPTMSNQSITYVTEDLYPEAYNGQPYNTTYGRTAQAISDYLVGCNAHLLASIPGSFGYYFSVPPAIHGEDIAYTFFNGDTSTSDEGLTVQAPIATGFQDIIGTFVVAGGAGLIEEGILPYGENFTVTNIGVTNFKGQIGDPAARAAQCNFWTEAPYDT